MLEKLVALSARRKYLTLLITCAFLLAGWLSLKNIRLDAIPDLTETQVIVYSEWDVSPDIIEDQVTYPIVTGLLGVPKVKDIRGVSMFGVSYVYVIFEEDTDLYWARSRVMEYLSAITATLPDTVKTRIGPDATGVGWVYQYALKDHSGKHNLKDLRTFQDWFLRYQLQALSGVSEVASFGGYRKQYQVQLNPELLRSYGITIGEVLSAIRKGNSETGAKVLEMGGAEYMLRLRGYANQLSDVENIVVKSTQSGTPIYVKNLGQVVLGPELRRGVGDLNGEGDAVGGIVVMRHGENAKTVIERVKQKLIELKPSLPEGVEVVTTYDRSSFIDAVIETLKEKTITEMLVVAFVIFIFLLHFTSALVPIFVLPAAVLIAFIPMLLMDITANVMSLAGILISIGAMVDASIVVVENCHKRLEKWREQGGQGVKSMKQVVIAAVQEVAPASFYSLLVIAVSFLPIFVLEAQEGKLFKPLAYTKTFSMMIAAFMAITFVPAILMFLVHERRWSFRPLWLSRGLNKLFSPHSYVEEKHPISKLLFKIYGPCVDQVLKHPKKTITVAIALLLLTVPIYFKLGSEFMPPLNEGTVLYMPTTMPSLSISEAQKLLQKQDQILMSFGEVKSVHGKAGRSDSATDSAPLTMMETVVVLKDQSQWPPKKRWYSSWPSFLTYPISVFLPEHNTWEELIGQMNEAMQIPGLTNAWTMPIKGRIDMLTTGIRTPVGIKVSGADLNVISQIGQSIEKSLTSMETTRSVFAERVTGGNFIDFNFNRVELARHGISIEEAQKDVQAAIGGAEVSGIVQGRERFSIQVRYARDFREDLDSLGQVLIASPKGYSLPLASVASLSVVNGPGMIRNENGLLTGYVFIDITTSDIGSYVEKAKAKLAQEIDLPQGYSLSWSGQFASMERVREKLTVVLPLTLLLVIVLIYLNTGSRGQTAIVLLAIPFSAIGAIWLLYFLGFNLSIAVWVGIIALIGVDAETGIFMLLYLDLAYNDHKKEGRLNSKADLREAIHEGAVKRIRPKMMTVLTTFFGLLPVLFASTSSAGADVMKRMAAPMVGGIFSSFALELLVYPAIYFLWKSASLPQQTQKPIKE